MHRVYPFVVSLGLSLAPLAAHATAPAAPAPEVKAPTIQFKQVNARVGDQEELDNAVDMRLALDLRASDMDKPMSVAMSVTSSSRHTVTVLAAKGKVISKVKMAFGDVGEVAEEQGKVQRKASPVSRKTYLAEWKKDRVVITNAAGKPVPKEEADEVTKHLPELGKPDRLEAAFPKNPLAVGATLDGFSDALAKQIVDEQGDDTRVTQARARLVEVRQDPRGAVGIFDVAMTVLRQEINAPFLLTIPLQGQMSVLAEGIQLLELTLSGPVKVELTDDAVEQGFEARGEGAMRLRLTGRKADAAR
ncbi:hypothetical protein QEG98_04910 [Myxococcus sp. MxC21-1]|uniref:hypothetical protein n=1 Tax=Myxococcus sp. MxC21-1 TaxID=3041439 RepID=UPI002931A654|nr:hypothetical protein [Myxococcus sp. MxC21-1]WNZ63130.1 hypothetical protein QEG98_04910 [Myxococcus sp. MxC21-1]